MERDALADRAPPQGRQEGARRTCVKMRAADTLSAWCSRRRRRARENIVGPREVPDHPLVFETIRDCLVEAMDLEGLRGLLEQLERGEIAGDRARHRRAEPAVARADQREPVRVPRRRAARGAPHPRGAAAPRRCPRRPSDAVGALDDGGDRARPSEEVAPTVRDADELHDALLALWLVPEGSARSLAPGARDWFEALAGAGRAARLRWERDGHVHAAWVATERLGAARAVLGEPSSATPMIATPSWSNALARARGGDRQSSSARTSIIAVRSRRARSPLELGLPVADVLARAARARRATARSCAARSRPASRSRARTMREALVAAHDGDGARTSSSGATAACSRASIA